MITNAHLLSFQYIEHQTEFPVLLASPLLLFFPFLPLLLITVPPGLASFSSILLWIATNGSSIPPAFDPAPLLLLLLLLLPPRLDSASLLYLDESTGLIVDEGVFPLLESVSDKSSNGFIVNEEFKTFCCPLTLVLGIGENEMEGDESRLPP